MGKSERECWDDGESMEAQAQRDIFGECREFLHGMGTNFMCVRTVYIEPLDRWAEFNVPLLIALSHHS